MLNKRPKTLKYNKFTRKELTNVFRLKIQNYCNMSSLFNELLQYPPNIFVKCHFTRKSSKIIVKIQLIRQNYQCSVKAYLVLLYYPNISRLSGTCISLAYP